MALETGSYISNLVSSNPTGSDRKLQGDDHLRLIKSVLQNSFAGLTGAIVVGGTNGGAANAYTLTPTPPLVSYVDNMTILFTPIASNTGPCTMNVSGIGNIDLRAVDGAVLIAGDLVAGQKYSAKFNGTNFRLESITKRYADQLAFSAELPNQTGNSGKFLTTDGSNASWSETFGVAVNERKGNDIPSTATIDLTAATGNFVHITGTTTITAITIPSGAERTVVFDGILTLTHNATTLILPTGANITTAPGDVAIIRGDGVGNARVVGYLRASGRSVIPAGWTLLAPPLTPAAAANVDALNIFSSVYDSYVIIGTGIKPAADDQPCMRVAVAGVVDSGATNYFFQNAVNASTTSGQNRFQLSNNTINVISAGKGIDFEVKLLNVNDSTDLKGFICTSQLQDVNTPSYRLSVVGGTHVPANTISGIRFFWNGGSNFAPGGEIRIYGIINTP